MDAEKSFSFPFEDKDWISKLGLGALISMVPILNFAWSGYLVHIMRNVMKDMPNSLPAWDDIDQKFKDGLTLFAAGFIYALPVLIGLSLPLSFIVLPGIFPHNSNLQAISQRILEAGGLLFFCLVAALLLYGLIFSILYPAILVLFAREGTFASCFHLREAFGLIRKNAGAFFTAWGLSWVASLGVGLLLAFVNVVVSWVPCIGWVIGTVLSLVSGAYITVVYAHLFGQFGRAAFERKQLAPPMPENPG